MRNRKYKRIYAVFLHVFLAILIFHFISCGSSADKIFRKNKFLMGTLVQITVIAPCEALAVSSMEKAFSEIRRIEDLCSSRVTSSDIRKINDSAPFSSVALHNDTLLILKSAFDITRKTEGCFDVTVGKLEEIWGFGGSEGENTQFHIPDKGLIKQVLPYIGLGNIRFDMKGKTIARLNSFVKIDLGGIAKGYAVDAAVGVLKRCGIKAGIVNAGGDLYAFGCKKGGGKWVIGIRHPRNREGLLAKLRVANKAVATSGDYERYFQENGVRYCHIIDPKTGYPACKCRSATVIGGNTMTADAVATAIFVMGRKRGLNLARKLGVEAVVVDANGEVFCTSRLKSSVEFF